jgi:plastocyanin
MKRLATITLAFALALSTVACSNDTEVGSGIDVEELSEKSKALGEIPEATGGGGFVGDAEEQRAKEEAEAKAAEAAAAAKAEQQAEEAREAAAVKVAITAAGYDPYYIRVFTGGVVQFTNKDKVVRNVTSDDGLFDSKDIAPGATWTLAPMPSKAGTYKFHDESCVQTRSGECGKRLSTIGTLEVIAR